MCVCSDQSIDFVSQPASRLREVDVRGCMHVLHWAIVYFLCSLRQLNVGMSPEKTLDLKKLKTQ